MSSNNAMLNTIIDRVDNNNTMNTRSQPMSIADVIVKTAICLMVVVAAAVPGWIYLSGSLILYLGILIATIIVGIVMSRKAPISPFLALGYSALLGLVVGAFSNACVSYGGNIALIPQAIVGTIMGAAGVLVVYSTPFGKKASRAGKLFFALMIGYFFLGIASAIAGIFFGVGNGWGFYGVGGIGLILCLVGVAFAAWSLLIDVGETDRALTAGVPQSYDWTFGVSLAASLVWLYLELVRLLTIFSGLGLADT